MTERYSYRELIKSHNKNNVKMSKKNEQQPAKDQPLIAAEKQESLKEERKPPEKISVAKWLERLRNISLDQKQEVIEGLKSQLAFDRERQIAEYEAKIKQLRGETTQQPMQSTNGQEQQVQDIEMEEDQTEFQAAPGASDL